MGFFTAIQACFRQYVVFGGRASRAEFWYFSLFLLIASLCLDAIFAPLGTAFTIATLPPALAVGARRLHDTDHSAWWLLLVLTIFGTVLLFIWSCLRGDPGANRFGPDPLAEAPPMRL